MLGRDQPFDGRRADSIDMEGREMEAARSLRRAAPHAQPNRRIVTLADRILGREGRLVAARQAMGPATPAYEGPLVTLDPALHRKATLGSDAQGD